jgi:hypothetical protein
MCCLSVCLSVSLHLSVPWCLSGRPNSTKHAGINETMNDALTCNKFHLLSLVNTFKCKTKTQTKTKTKKRIAVVSLLYDPHLKKERQKQGFCIIPKWTLCNVQSVAVWNDSYVTLFTALIPVHFDDEECWNVHCVSSMFRSATLRTDNYNICR